MRPIKLRLWDNNQKEFIKPDFIHLQGNGNFSWWDEVNGIEAFNGDTCGSQGFLTEFTGLYDKKGKEIKEIYEGDIVKADWVVGKWKIAFSGGSFMMNIIPDTHAQIFIQNELVEVIGNIYENPELLEEKK